MTTIGTAETTLLHLRVELGALFLDLQGRPQQIDEVAAELTAAGAAAISIDNHITATMPSLPCSQPWDP
ncbi:hypothetical protein ACWEP5_01265 [Nocardia niigatensis]